MVFIMEVDKVFHLGFVNTHTLFTYGCTRNNSHICICIEKLCLGTYNEGVCINNHSI